MKDKDTNMPDTEPSEAESLKNNWDLIPDTENSADGSKKFNHESARMALAKMFILDELPFKLVERKRFKHFMSAIERSFRLPSHITLIKDCYRVYIDEKFKLKELLSNVGSRICLSAKTWTSMQNVSYLCLTAHFMDDDWKLHRKILNFFPILGDKGEEIGRIVESSVLSWGIENVCTLTLENSVSNDVAMIYLKDKLHRQNYLLFGGEFFHIRCSANILNLIVRDCLDEVQTSVARIRDAVKYVRSTTSGAEKFKRCIMKEQITSSRSICLDVETKWSSTYSMLNSALNFQRVFEMLEEDDPEFLEDLHGGAPTIDDWNNARVLVRFLEIFYDASERLSGSYVTCTLYFKQVCFIQFTLDEWAKSSELYLQSLALKMKERFTIYWGSVDETNLLLLISMALDPRCKVRSVRCFLTKVYPTEPEKVDSVVNQVIDVMKRLFDYYKKIDSTSLPKCAKAQDALAIEADKPIGRDFQFKYNFYSEYKKFVEEKERPQRELELQRYLEEDCEILGVNASFDILSWWKMYGIKYRVLSKIAKDLLSIPVSTLDSEAACNFGDRALGQFQSSLTPMIVESLICAQNWLQTSQLPVAVEEDLEELEKLEELDSGNLQIL
ncbi:hypothetical protein REPUB_Repub06bG0087100 [Reevesia pubescens]